MRILAVETSCDETAVALLTFTGTDAGAVYDITGEIIHSQTDTHAQYGGVYPTLAKREHQNILPRITRNLLEDRGCLHRSEENFITETAERFCDRNHELLERIREHIAHKQPEGIDALAVTQGPGLAPALWVGVTFARVLSVLWNIPIIPVNHLEGHIVSALSDGNRCFRADYPVLTLIVSGGHTELVYSEKPGTYIKVGSTLDDAAGEAFDKTARLLGLPYPGGPAIQRSAENARKKKLTPPAPLPRPMLRDKSLNFSYAGLKTAVRTLTEKTKILSEDERSAVAMEFENAVVETLTEKTKIGIEQYAPKTVAVGGGVSANAHLRREMKALVEKYPGMRLCLPSVAQATDNAVMIALAAYTHRNDTADPETLRALPNLSFPAQ